MNRAPLLELSEVSRHYVSGESRVVALDRVSLTIWPGDFIAIMGQSGSGKSTLMNLLGCLDRPSSGSYRVLGRDVAALSPDQLAALRRDTFGFVFQRYNLITTATAGENVELPAVYAGMPGGLRHARARQLLAKLGLERRADHRPFQLSGGQQQRVAIARTLINDPPVILADEPTGALDSRSGTEVMALLRHLHGEGRTIILITHDESIAAQAERCLRIHDGHLEPALPAPFAGAAEALRREPPHIAGSLRYELREAAVMALQSLRVNGFRTALTLLGVVIGVASVVTLLAVGNGSKQAVLDQINAMGTQLLSVRPGAPGMRSDVVTLTPADAEAIRELPGVALVMPERSARHTLRYGNVDYPAAIQGVTPDLPDLRQWPLAEGAFFSDDDMRGYAAVAVLGQSLAQRLFPDGESPIGRFVLVRSTPFQVVGVLQPKGAGADGSDRDEAALIPLTTGLVRLFGRAYVNGITVKVQGPLGETEQAISDLLQERHRAQDFSIRNMASLMEMATSTQDTLTVMLGAVAAISLLVGGIGVMNIMLVSVTERTREIGVRMATGARARDILLQFNTEAVVVCTLGGLLGVALGLAVGLALRRLDVAVVFSVEPPVIAFGCALATGMLFGYLPARRAAHLDPVRALASE